MTRQGFPDLHITVDEVFGEGDQVPRFGPWRAPTPASGFGAPASGKRARWWGVAITRFDAGRIAEDWYNFDQVSLLQQLGIIPGIVRDAWTP